MVKNRRSSRGRTADGSPNPIDVFVGARVKMRRTLLGMSQEKLGELVGLSQKQISRIENYRTASLWKVKRIADVFGITVDELIGGERQDRQDRKRREPEGR